MYGTAYRSLSLPVICYSKVSNRSLVVTAPSVNSFKNRLDKHWALQELKYDWKQNYQEPGVEAELNFEFFESYHFVF